MRKNFYERMGVMLKSTKFCYSKMTQLSTVTCSDVKLHTRSVRVQPGPVGCVVRVHSGQQKYRRIIRPVDFPSRPPRQLRREPVDDMTMPSRGRRPSEARPFRNARFSRFDIVFRLPLTTNPTAARGLRETDRRSDIGDVTNVQTDGCTDAPKRRTVGMMTSKCRQRQMHTQRRRRHRVMQRHFAQSGPTVHVDSYFSKS